MGSRRGDYSGQVRSLTSGAEAVEWGWERTSQDVVSVQHVGGLEGTMRNAKSQEVPRALLEQVWLALKVLFFSTICGKHIHFHRKWFSPQRLEDQSVTFCTIHALGFSFPVQLSDLEQRGRRRDWSKTNK